MSSAKEMFSTIRTGSPSKKIKVIGVTGTRGKTVVTHMLHHMFKNAGAKAGFISTLGYSVDGENVKNDQSANKIDGSTVNKLLNQMLKNKMEYALVEMTSNNLRNKNYPALLLDSGIITNIYLDSPEAYKDWANYAETKMDFINKIKPEGLLVFHNHNNDVASWVFQNAQNLKNNIYTFLTDYTNASNIQQNVEGTSFDYDGQNYNTKLIGFNNVYNAIQALKLAQAYMPNVDFKPHLETFEAPVGRIQVVQKEPFTIIIDYAYTPHMIEEALISISALKKSGQRIITVLGTSGEQNKDRRIVGAVAAKYSDIVMLAAEDPRSERVADINTELQLRAQPLRAMFVERFNSDDEYKLINKTSLKLKIERVINNSDVPFVGFDAEDYTSRLDAIDFAIKVARPGDIVYITGKGHETTMSFADVDYEWSDSEAVKQALGKSVPAKQVVPVKR